MPWTFAHAAAVLPLRRFCPRWLNFSALMEEAATPYRGVLAVAVLMRCITVFGTVAFALLAVACSSYCYWRSARHARIKNSE